MSRRFFTLIHGGKIRVGPKTKVIPAKQFAKALRAGEVLNLIQEDTEKYRLEVIEECEKVKEAAYGEGYQNGFKEWTKFVAALEDKIREVQKELEQLVVPLAMNAAKKIVGREIEVSPNVIVDIVSSSLKAVTQHKKIVIFVNKKDLQILEEHKPQLKTLFEHLESLAIREREDIEPGGCIIETEGGIINAQLSNKWKALEEAFEALIKEQHNES